jgi:signal transduction histidine kinase
MAAGAALATWVQLSTGPRDFAAHYVRPTWLLVFQLAAAGAAVAAAVAPRPAVIGGLALALAGVLLPAWAAWPQLPPAAATALLATGPLAVPGVALLAGTRRTGAVLAVAACASAVLFLGYDPFTDPVCWETCVQAHPVLAGWLSTPDAVATAAGCVLLACVLAAGRLARPATPLPRPVGLVAAAGLALLAAAAAVRLVRWQAGGGQVAARVLPALAVTAVCVAVLVTEVRRRRWLRAVRRLVAGLAMPESALDASVAGIDAVDFAVPGSETWVDAAGREVPPPAGDCLVPTDGAGPVVRLRLSPGAPERAVLAALTPSTWLALRNAQLTAAGRAQLAQVQASRRRIVRTSDAERRRIERDLHDGAQQRMVIAALHLQVAQARVPPPAAAAIGRAEERLRRSLARLRELVHGIFPTALADDGLVAAVEELAAGAGVALSLDLEVEPDLDPDVAMAAYATIADTVAGAPHAIDVVGVRVRHDDAALTVCLTLPGPAPELRELLVDAADRVGALGGTFAVTDDDRGAAVRAVIPCGSS